MIECQISQCFAVQANAFLAEQVDETAVVDAHRAYSGTDTGNPEATVGALFEFAVAVGVLPTFFERVFRYSVDFGTGAEEAACGQHDFFPAGATGRAVCCSRHKKIF